MAGEFLKMKKETVAKNATAPAANAAGAFQKMKMDTVQKPGAQIAPPAFAPADSRKQWKDVGGGRVSTSPVKKPTFADRVGNTLSGYAKGVGSDFANLGGSIVEGLGKLNTLADKAYSREEDRIAAENVARYREQLKTEKTQKERDRLEMLIRRNSGVADINEQYRAAQEAQTKSVADAAYRKSDELDTSSEKDITRAKQGAGKLGQLAVDLGVGGMQIAGDLAANAILPGSGLAMMFARGVGGSAREARQSGASYGQQMAYGLTSGALSVATEKIANVAGPFKKAFGSGVLDKAIAGATGKLGSTAAGKVALSALSEGGEEVVEALLQPILQRATYDPEAMAHYNDPDYWTGVLYDGLVGGILGGLGGGVELVGQKLTDTAGVWMNDRGEKMFPDVEEARQKDFRQAEQIAANFGAKLQVGSLANGAAGEYRNGTITIDPTTENPVRQVLLHELTHHMETSGLYRQFSDKVLAFAAEDLGVDVGALEKSIISEYGRYGVELDQDGAARELVAKFAEEKLFQDEKSIQRLLQTDRNLFQKIYDWLRETVAKVKGTDEERFLIDAQRLYEKALRQAGTVENQTAPQNLFAGENARTADFAALQKAQEWEREGFPMGEIRYETGWFRGADGKWRFEIDDSQMQYHERRVEDGAVPGQTLADYITHDELFENYPQLRKVGLEFAEMEPGVNGQYNYGTNTITLSNELRSAPEATIVHEVQHAIQKAEGFARGANTNYWNRMLENGYDSRTQMQRRETERLWQEYNSLRDNEPEFFEDMNALDAMTPNMPRGKIDWDTLQQIEEDPVEWQRYDAAREALEEKYGDMKVFDFIDLRYKLKQSELNSGRTATDLYYNTAGEIEARDAARRRSWSLEQREETMPDTGNEDTVFAGDGARAFSSEEVPDSVGAVYLLRDNLDELRTMETVSTVNGTEIPTEGKPTERAMQYLNSIGGKVERPGFGEVLFSKSKVKNSLLGHGFGEAKIELLAGVPGVIQNGQEIASVPNWKGRGYDSFVFAAPVDYRGERVYVTAIVVRDQANRYYLHEAVDENGNVLFGQNKSPDTASDGSEATPQSTVAGTELSTIIVPQENGESNRKVPDIMPKLDGGQNSMGRSFSELVANQRDGVELGTNGQMELRMPKLEAPAPVENTIPAAGVPELKMPTLERGGSEAEQKAGFAEQKAVPGGPETEGYMDALARDENELVDPVTPADIVYDAKLRGLQDEEAPPETSRERIPKRDLDELVDLLQDIASPVSTARDARFEESENLVSAGSKAERRTARETASEAKSYFMRKMVDAGDSVSRVGKAVKDKYLYPFYNAARASASAGVNMITDEQTDIAGNRVGESLNDIFTPIREKGENYYNQFQLYLFDLHNIDRMSLVRGDNTARLDAEVALREFDRENPDVAQLTEARLLRKSQSIDEEEAALAKERLRLLRRLNQADRMGNKPVFGYEVSAEMSQERSDRLLREHPEFAGYRKQVRTYIDNLMQYRVDSGLMTEEDAAFLAKYYPNYVPTQRRTERVGRGRDRKSVQVGKTVGRAQGGNEKLVPLHEALGKQTMQVVREGSKNRFGARLLEDYENANKAGAIGRYILDAQEYESGFDPDAIDGQEPDLRKENTFTVFRNGKKYEMTVDPSMFDAVKALSPDAQESNVVVKAIRAGNNLFKALVTGYNPTFTVRNTVRDLQTAGLYTRDGAAFAKNYPLALKEIASEGEYWKKYKALGGSFSSVFDYQTGTVKEADGKITKMAAKMEALNMAMEQAPRLAEFMSVVKAGDGSMENLVDAMHAAADVTVNFGRAGTLGKVLNANFVPFLNPGIQGFDKMIRRVTETKGAKEWAKLAVRAAALGVAPTVINGLLYSDDDDWEDLKDSDKDTNYLFKIKDGLWLKIPKGRELSVLGMTADRVQDLAKGEDVNWRDFIVTVGNQVAPANPLNQNIVKAWFDADLFDATSPGRTWYGGDIESQRLRNYAPGERYDSSTDAFSKWVGKQLGLSPKKINYLLDQYSGVVGDFLLPLMTPQAERDPFTKAFTVDSVSSNRISGAFYDKSDELTYAKNSGDTAAKVVGRFWTKQQQACSEIYAQIREIEESDLSDKEKKQKVREAKAVLNGIQKNAMEALGTYEKAVEKHLRGTSDEAIDTAYRKANRECFGAEYALKYYSKDVYEKAQQAKANGVSYDDYYTYYFDTKDFKSREGKSTTTQKVEYLERSKLKEPAKAEIYFADLASDSDLTRQAELETSNGITPVQYWQYKVATMGVESDKDASGKSISGSKKRKMLDAINGLDLTVPQKDALYRANGWAESTLHQAPWYDIGPKLTTGGTTKRPSKQTTQKVPELQMPKLVGGTSLGSYGLKNPLEKYRMK